MLFVILNVLLYLCAIRFQEHICAYVNMIIQCASPLIEYQLSIWKLQERGHISSFVTAETTTKSGFSVLTLSSLNTIYFTVKKQRHIANG